MVKPNFKRAKEEAYKTLMLQENFSFQKQKIIF